MNPKIRTIIVPSANLFDRSIGGPGFNTQFRWQRTSLRNVVHLSPFSQGLLKKVEFRMLLGEPGRIAVAFRVLALCVSSLRKNVS